MQRICRLICKICRICKQKCNKICTKYDMKYVKNMQNMQKNMQNMSDQKIFQVCPKICKICNKYAKNVSQNLICRICTPHFADVVCVVRWKAVSEGRLDGTDNLKSRQSDTSPIIMTSRNWFPKRVRNAHQALRVRKRFSEPVAFCKMTFLQWTSSSMPLVLMKTALVRVPKRLYLHICLY